MNEFLKDLMYRHFVVKIHLFERYSDGDALQHHRETDHYKAYRAKIVDYLAEPIGVLVLDAVDAAN